MFFSHFFVRNPITLLPHAANHVWFSFPVNRSHVNEFQHSSKPLPISPHRKQNTLLDLAGSSEAFRLSIDGCRSRSSRLLSSSSRGGGGDTDLYFGSSTAMRSPSPDPHWRSPLPLAARPPAHRCSPPPLAACPPALPLDPSLRWSPPTRSLLTLFFASSVT